MAQGQHHPLQGLVVAADLGGGVRDGLHGAIHRVEAECLEANKGLRHLIYLVGGAGSEVFDPIEGLFTIGHAAHHASEADLQLFKVGHDPHGLLAQQYQAAAHYQVLHGAQLGAEAIELAAHARQGIAHHLLGTAHVAAQVIEPGR